jgi:hypothetical protein
MIAYLKPCVKYIIPEKSTQLIEAAGFEVLSIKDIGPYHYMTVAKPS